MSGRTCRHDRLNAGAAELREARARFAAQISGFDSPEAQQTERLKRAGAP